MKNTTSIALTSIVILASPYLAMAEDAPAAAPAPEYTATSNVYIVSDYYFRGQTQNWHKPAVQGGFDLSHASGVYVGTWLSNVSGNQYAGGSLEWDYYGGYNGKISDDLSWTVGGYGYYYPGANWSKAPGSTTEQSFNTFEGNVGITWKWVSVKVSRAFTDYFGANDKTGFEGDTKGTYYLDVSATYSIMDDLTVMGHVGRTHFAKKLATPTADGTDDASYTDLKLGVTKTFKDGWAVSAAWVKGTNSSVFGMVSSFNDSSQTEDLVKSRLVLSVGRTF